MPHGTVGDKDVVFNTEGGLDDASRLAVNEADAHLLVEFYLHHQIDWICETGGTVPVEMSDRIEELKGFGCKVELHPTDPRLVVVSPAPRPIYRDKEYVRVIVPGDRSRVVEEPVEERHKRRFPKQYSAFKLSQNQDAASGTPLKEVSFLSSARREELLYFGVRTVEQLANMSDANVGKIGMGGQDLRERARRYLQAAKDSSAMEKAQDLIKAKDAEIAKLRDGMGALAARLDALEARKDPAVQAAEKE